MNELKMDEGRRYIRSNFTEKSTEELLQLWKENDRSQWTDETFDVIQSILEERGEDIPAQEEIHCEQCGAKILPDARFCFNCGNYLLDNCMVCNQPLPDRSNYCPNCGSEIKKQIKATAIPNTETLLNFLRVSNTIIIIILLYLVLRLILATGNIL